MTNQTRRIHDYDVTAKEFASAADFEKYFIITPPLTVAFNKAVQDKTFDPKTEKMIDIGCGPFLLSLPFIRDGIHVDGLDKSPNMIKLARDMLDQTDLELNGTKLVVDSTILKPGDYGFTMMNFVHQCCADVQSLHDLFKTAHDLMRPGARLVLTAAHPKYLHIPHAAYQYSVPDITAIKDTDTYEGYMHDKYRKNVYRLEGDHYWKIKTLAQVAENVGFEVLTVEDIKDVDAPSRRGSQEPAYLMMTYQKLPATAPA